MSKWIKRVHFVFDVVAIAIIGALVITFLMVVVLHIASERNALSTIGKAAVALFLFEVFLHWVWARYSSENSTPALSQKGNSR